MVRPHIYSRSYAERLRSTSVVPDRQPGFAEDGAQTWHSSASPDAIARLYSVCHSCRKPPAAPDIPITDTAMRFNDGQQYHFQVALPSEDNSGSLCTWVPT